jgi:hypothetical protein
MRASGWGCPERSRCNTARLYRQYCERSAEDSPTPSASATRLAVCDSRVGLTVRREILVPLAANARRG